MKRAISLLFFAFLIPALPTLGQSETCLSAPTLSVTSTCVYVPFDADNATSDGPATASCAGTVSGSDDAWARFTATSEVTLINYLSTNNVSLIVYQDVACGSLAAGDEIACSDQTGNNEKLNFPTTTGNDYIIRIVNGRADDQICIQAVEPPANDLCANAIEVEPTGFCQIGTLSGASGLNDTQNGSGTCGSPARTVWYRFTATASTHVLSLQNYEPASDLAFSVYTGSCGSLTETDCINGGGDGADELATLSGLSIGTTYFVRVNGFNEDDLGTFCFQVYNLTPPNDLCGSATVLEVGQNCFNGAINNATATLPEDNNTCGGDIDNSTETVWYRFTATSTEHMIEILSEDTGFDPALSLYEGTCSGLSEIACDTDTDRLLRLTENSLTVGQEYFVRVAKRTSSSIPSNFCILIREQPANDDCANSIPLTVDAVCTDGQNYLSTDEPPLPNASCINERRSVWYHFEATATTHIIQLDIKSEFADMGYAVFSATAPCTGLSQIACQEQSGSGIIFGREASSVSGLTIGETYYIMVAPDNWSQADFCIKVESPPENDDCINATDLTIDAACTVGTTLGTSASVGPGGSGCIFDDNSVWYRFTATDTRHTVKLTNGELYEDNSDRDRDIAFRVYQTDNCGSVGGATEVVCVNDNPEGENEMRAFTTIPGETYLVMVDVTGGDQVDDLCIQVLSPFENDLICNAQELQTNFSCVGATLSGATSVATDPPAACGVNDHVLWYFFEATSTTHSVAATNHSEGANSDFVIEVYSSTDNTCSGTLTSLACSNEKGNSGSEDFEVSGLTIGARYFVAVRGQNNDDDPSFCISVTDQAEACENAAPIRMNASCVAGGNLNADAIAIEDASCLNEDATSWYSFVADQSVTTISLSDVDSDGRVQLVIWEGVCGSLRELDCESAGTGDNIEMTVSNLVPGQRYYAMIDEYAGSPSGFCVRALSPQPCSDNAPPTDDCLSAPLIANLDGYCGATDFTFSRTYYNTLRNMRCDGFSTVENNSFLRFIAESDQVVLQYDIISDAPNGGPPCDEGIQINIFEVVGGTSCEDAVWSDVTDDCVNPSGGTGSVGELTASNLVPGQEYYIVFDGYAGDECGFALRALEGGGVLLPLEILSFSGYAENGQHHLLWQTELEESLEAFLVERSQNGHVFETIGTVLPNASGEYYFQDAFPLSGTNYYRLTVQYRYGGQEFSKVISLRSDPNLTPQLRLYPNPADTRLYFQTNKVSASGYKVLIIDSNGRQLKSIAQPLESDKTQGMIHIASLPAGLYLFKLIWEDSGEMVVRRFLKN